MPHPLIVVVAGTGALPALGTLVRALAVPPRRAVVVAAPDGMCGPIAALVADAGAADGVTVTTEASVFDGAGWSTAAPSVRPVDRLLSSVARHAGPAAVAVILSGADADGADGALALWNAGGLVLVEAPAGARVDARPRAVVGTGCVDAVLPAEGLAEAIVARADTLARQPGTDPRAVDLAELMRSERFLRTITDNLPATVSYWDRHLLCRFANAPHRAWYGLDPASMLGRPFRELLGEALFAKAEPYVTAALAGRPQQYERVVPKDDGRICFVLARYLPHVVDGEVVGLFAIVTDVSEERAAQRELLALNQTLEQRVAERTAERDALVRKVADAHKLESLAALAGGIAHDFNNRLTAILGAASLLDDGFVGGADPGRFGGEADPDASARAREAAAIITSSSRRAAHLCRQLLAYAGRGRFVLDHGDLTAVVARSVAALQPTLPGAVQLHLALQPDLPPVAMDPDQIGQVVVNLVQNAVEALGPAGGAVTVCTERCAVTDELRASALTGDLSGAECVALEVADTGHGITRDDLGRIFEPFFTTRSKGAGRGLGLSAVQGIVRGHGGAVAVRTGVGEGAVFRVLLPAASPAPSTSTRQAPTPAGWRGAGVVLLADDEPLVQRISERVLSRLGFEIDLASDGLDAVDQFRAAPDRYALVVLDLTMPRMSGAEALVAIRALRPSARVLVMSGYTRDDPSATFLEQRPNAFLSKPFELATLAAAVREALG